MTTSTKPAPKTEADAPVDVPEAASAPLAVGQIVTIAADGEDAPAVALVVALEGEGADQIATLHQLSPSTRRFAYDLTPA